MNMKYIKQINMVMAIAFVFGAVTLFASSAHAQLSIMDPGVYDYQVPASYIGLRIMTNPTTSNSLNAPIIPLDVLYGTPVTQAPVVAQAPTVTPTVVSQPVIPIISGTQTTTTTQPTTATTTQTTVQGTRIKAPIVNSISSTTKTVTPLSANSNIPGICPSDTVNYTLNYANTTTDTISNAMMVVAMPAEIDYVSSTASANYNAQTRTVTIFIGTLTKGQTGVVYLQGTANRSTSGTNTISTRADFTFTKADGTNATTTNYVIHSGTNCGNALGANALGSGFLPTSFGGWLLLALILCAVIFILQKFFKKESGHAHGGSMEHTVH